MTTVWAAQMPSPIGPLTVAATEQGICNVHFGDPVPVIVPCH